MASATYAIRVTDDYTNAVKDHSGTLDELTQRFSHSLEMGKRYDGEIDAEPKTAQSLVESLNKAAVANMANKRYEFLGETKRVPYRNWKNWFSECETVKGSYDAKKRTIEVVFPDGYCDRYEDFSGDEWESTLMGMHLVGYDIFVESLGGGAFQIRAFDKEPMISPDWKVILPGVPEMRYQSRTTFPIPGRGYPAQDAAIKKARELAVTGLYNR